MGHRWAVIAILVTAGGCSEAEPLSRSEFARQADEICRDVAGRWDEVEPPVVEQPVTEEGFAELMAFEMETGRTFGGEVLDRVGALNPPPSLEPRVDRMLDALGRIVDDLDAYAAALEGRNEAELERLGETVDEGNQEVFQAEAESLGLEACAKGLFLSSWRAGSQPIPEPSSSRSGDGR